jgi:membrane-bound metal-dependent hydrolase YbcI (DUF457 family)
MADFKSHMTFSTATGAVLAVAGYKANLPLDTCLVAGCLCSVSGMLPDLDSNSGRPLREATAMGAAVVPMLMVERLQRLNLNHDTMVLIAIFSYLTIRLVVAEIFRRYTVHRGMWHSLPAAAICGMIAFMVVDSEDIGIRCFKTAAVVLGFLSHLILDEIWSIDFKRGTFRFKQSFGTALKLWGNNRFANGITYAKLLIFSVLVYQDQGYMAQYQMNPNVPHTFGELVATIREKLDRSGRNNSEEALIVDLDPPALPVWSDSPPIRAEDNLNNALPGTRSSVLPTQSWPPPQPRGWQ